MKASAIIALLFLPCIPCVADQKESKAGSDNLRETIIERSPALHSRLLGTSIGYEPLKAEAKFYEKLPLSERDWASEYIASTNPKDARASTETQKPEFSLSGHVREFVSWFGILRAAEKIEGGYKLVIQNKYYDGTSDLHIQTVSIRGAGDFDAIVHCSDFSLNPLVLVRIYGKVTREENGRPLVDVEYLRYWNWLYFNFRDYGKDKGNSAYDKDLDLTGLRIYSSRVSPNYYSQRIQATREQLDIIDKWLEDNKDALNKEFLDARK